MSSRFLRNKDLINQDLLEEITVIGLGGIGSALIYPLAIMGFNKIIGFDDDTLEEHNLSTTMYPMSAVGKPKAEAARNIAAGYGTCAIEMVNEIFVEGSPVTPMMIVCTDSMRSRKTVYQEWVKQPKRVALVDIRMGALSIVVVTTTAKHDDYMSYWQSDESISDDPCTMKHTIFTAELAAGFGVNQLFSAISNRFYHEKIWIGLQPVRIETGKFINPME